MSQIFNENCLIGMNNIPDSTISLIICDLPFGVTDCKWDIKLDLQELWGCYKRILKPNGCVLLFGVGIFFAEVILSNKEWFKYDVVWEKERPTNIFLLKKRIGMVHEHIAVFYNKQPTYNPIMEKRAFNTIGVFGKNKISRTHKDQDYKYSENYDNSVIYPRSVLKFNRDTLKGAIHETQKPVELLKYLIETFSNKDDIILDNCMGSGSTIVAAIQSDRNYIGFEIDSYLFDLAKERINRELELKKNFFVSKKPKIINKNF